MSITVHKIAFAPILLNKLEGFKTTYATKDDAVEALSGELNWHEIDFSVQEKDDKMVFINSSGGELAVVEARG